LGPEYRLALNRSRSATPTDQQKSPEMNAGRITARGQSVSVLRICVVPQTTVNTNDGLLGRAC
jgi:hypothetical protein